MKEFDVSTEMLDVEIIHISSVNIIARGRRYGRWWLLKGLIEQHRNSPIALLQLQKEFELHSRLLNPGISQVVSFEEIEGLGHCIVEEWRGGKRLSELLKAGVLSNRERIKIMRKLINIVGYIHSRGVAHHNIKPSNIMVCDMGADIVLTDFGLTDTDDYGDDIFGLGMIMKELCPEYSGIAAKCVGPIEKRPKDTTKLLKSIDIRDRMPKVIWSILGIGILIGLGAVMGLYFHSLNSTTRDARDKVLTLSETTRQQEMQVTGLNDSLTSMTVRINKVHDEIRGMDDYSEMRKELYVVACKKIDKLFEDFENNVVPMFDKVNLAFYDSVSILLDKSQYICNSDYDPGRLPELNKKDALELHNNLVLYYQCKYSEEHPIWEAIINNSSDLDITTTPETVKLLSNKLATKRALHEAKENNQTGERSIKKGEKEN